VLEGWRAFDRASPGAFADYHAALNSDIAKIFALERACSHATEFALNGDPQTHDAWVAALNPLLSGSPAPFGLAYVSRFWECSEIAAEAGLFAGEWTALKDGLAPGEIADLRLTYLAKFDDPDSIGFSEWAGIATNGPSVRARTVAVERIARRSTDVEEWHPFFVDLMGSTEASEVLRWAITGLLRTAPNDGSGAEQIVELLRGVLMNPVPQSVHGQAICGAYSVFRYPTFPNGEDAEPVWEVAPAWDDFVRDLEPAPLAVSDRAYLADPSKCL
jgi:hypothetical protein